MNPDYLIMCENILYSIMKRITAFNVLTNITITYNSGYVSIGESRIKADNWFDLEDVHEESYVMEYICNVIKAYDCSLTAYKNIGNTYSFELSNTHLREQSSDKLTNIITSRLKAIRNSYTGLGYVAIHQKAMNIITYIKIRSPNYLFLITFEKTKIVVSTDGMSEEIDLAYSDLAYSIISRVLNDECIKWTRLSGKPVHIHHGNKYITISQTSNPFINTVVRREKKQSVNEIEFTDYSYCD